MIRENTLGNKKTTCLPDDFDWNAHVPNEVLSQFMMNAPNGYVITDIRQKENPVVFVNLSFYELTGYKAEDILGKKCEILLGKDKEQSVLKQFRDAVEHKRGCTAVVRNYRKDSSLFYNELSMVPICDRSGNVTLCIWMQKDVTSYIEEIENLTALIAIKEERFAAYTENANEAIWRLDFEPPISLAAPESQQVQSVFDNGVFAEANDVAAEVYGFKKGKEVIGRPLKEFMKDITQSNKEIVLDLVQNKFIMEHMVSKEITSDGVTKIVLNNIRRLEENNEVRSIWGASLDVSDFFEVQKALKRSKKKLKKQTKRLKNKNIALKELIVQIGLDKKEYNDRISANIQHLVLPSLDKIALNGNNKELVEQHRKTLMNLTLSFGLKISDSKVKLSPREIEVCNLVRNGLSNKEISRLLNIALHTVQKHRRTVRSKLGLANKKINLHTYLNSM